jgi:NAD(P)-dependent dehydrogenase (short-subunit alcohol dehydrogenase family)
MNPTCDFKGQVALVTGAAKGMGLATARMFADSGASVVLADIDGDLAAKEAERIVFERRTAIGIACDVADKAQVAARVDGAEILIFFLLNAIALFQANPNPTKVLNDLSKQLNHVGFVL